MHNRDEHELRHELYLSRVYGQMPTTKKLDGIWASALLPVYQII